MLCHLAHSHLTFALPHHWTCDENAILGQLNRQNAKAPGVGGIPAQENSDLKNRFSARFVVGRGSQPQLPPMQLSGFRVRNLKRTTLFASQKLARRGHGGRWVTRSSVESSRRSAPPTRRPRCRCPAARGTADTRPERWRGPGPRRADWMRTHTPGHSGGGTSPGA